MKPQRILFNLLCGLLATCLLRTVAANPFEATLANGLKLIVKEDRRAPTAVHMIWYRVGSMDEADGSSGLAHVLEHMMFKGTPSVGPGEFARRVSAAGGHLNAFTNSDYTAYFQQIPKEKLEEMMALEADRMRHLTLDAKEFEQEIKVVMEERRTRTDDNPHSKLIEQMHAVAFLTHPYRRPVIGWMSDLENMTIDDLRLWYQRWYVPNNAIMVVVGDVSHEEVFRLAEKHYGPIPSRSLPLVKTPSEPPQAGMRRILVKAPAELPLLAMGYKAPALRDIAIDRDPYALEMLTAVLDGYDAARFNKRLVREQKIAVSAGTSYDATQRGPGMFTLYAIPAEGRTVAELEAALRAEIARIQKDGVNAAELERARAQLVAAQIYKLDSTLGQATEIGGLELTGIPHKDILRIIERLKLVTAEEVQIAANKVFSDDGLTVGVLDPQPLDKGAAPAAPPSR